MKKVIVVSSLLSLVFLGACNVSPQQTLEVALGAVSAFVTADGALSGISTAETNSINTCVNSVENIVKASKTNWVTNADLAWSSCDTLALSPATIGTIQPYIDAVQMTIEILYASGLV
jgi:mannose/fructose/N-acetylgalactosamine-specific phosphotransferase system component IIC